MSNPWRRVFRDLHVKLGEKVPEYEVRIFPNIMKKKYGGQTLIKIENGKPFSSFGEIELPGSNWVTVGRSLLMIAPPFWKNKFSKQRLLEIGKESGRHNSYGVRDLERETINSFKKENNNDESDEKDFAKLEKLNYKKPKRFSRYYNKK